MVDRSGVGVLTLLYSQRAWILRRIERVDFEDALTTRRRSSLDIYLGSVASDLEAMPVWGGRALLPIMQVSRSSHFDIVVERASGEALPFLPRSQERRLLSEGLADVLGSFESGGNLPNHDQTWTANVSTILSLIDEAPHIVTAVPSPFEQISSFIEDLRTNHIVIAAVEPAELFADSDHKLLRINETHAESLNQTKGRSFQVGPVLRDFYRTASTTHRVAYSGHGIERPADWLPLWGRDLRLDDQPITVPTSLIDSTESYHIEVVCPTGVYVEKATLVSTVQLPSGQIEVLEIVEDDFHWDAAHASFHYKLHSEADSPKDILGLGSRRMDSRLLILLRPMYHGLMRTGQNVSILATALLWLLTWTLGWAATGWPALVALVRPSGELVDPVVAVVLLAPTAVLGVIVRQDESLMTKAVADGFRRRIGALALITFSSAVATAIGVDGVLLLALLFGLSCSATVITAMTWRSARRSEARVASPPPRPSWS